MLTSFDKPTIVKRLGSATPRLDCRVNWALKNH